MKEKKGSFICRQARSLSTGYKSSGGRSSLATTSYLSRPKDTIPLLSLGLKRQAGTRNDMGNRQKEI